MCSDAVGVFASKLVNAADSTVAFVVVDVAAATTAAAVDVEFAGKIVALIDWIVDNEPMLFGVEAIFSRDYFFCTFETTEIFFPPLNWSN